MQSFLIESKDQIKAEEYALSLSKSRNISFIDITTIVTETSIGIADVRNIQKTLYFTPVKSRQKAYIIKNAHTLTIEAQNALLKILEEPPPHAIIVLLAENKEALLPTVLSRCQIIEIKSPTTNVSKDKYAASSFLQSSIGERLKLAQDIAKDKDNVLPWLEKQILATREELLASNITGGNAKLVSILRLLQKTYTIVQTTNVNPRLTLENLFLSI